MVEEATTPARNRAQVALRSLAQTDRTWLVLLVALTLGLSRDTVFGAQIYFHRDISMYWWVQVESFVRSIFSGSWPLWNEAPCFGQPLLASPDVQALYPLTWLNLLMPSWAYYTVFVVVHLAFSAMGTYLLARHFGTSRGASFVAGAVWLLCGPFVSLVDLWHHLAGAAWIPWVVLAAQRAFCSRRVQDSLGLAVVAAMQILAGSAEMCAMAWAAAGFLLLHRLKLRTPALGSRLKALALPGLALLLAVGLSAAQWLPTLDVASRSGRQELPREVREFWSVHPLALVETLVPVSLAELPLRSVARERFVGLQEPFLHSLYLGLATFPLVAAALLSRRRRPTRSLALLAVGATLVALGRHTPIYTLATTLFPIFQMFRYPVKVMILVGLAWSLLAGLGFDAWRRPERDRFRAGGRPLLVFTIVFVALAVAATLAVKYDAAGWTAAFLTAARPGLSMQALGDRLAGAALVTMALSALAAVRRRRTLAGGAAALVAVVAVGDLFLRHRTLNPTAPRRLYDFRPVAVERIRTDAELSPERRPRVYTYEYGFLGARGGRGHDERTLAQRFHEHPLTPRRRIAGMPDLEIQAVSRQKYLGAPLVGRWGMQSAFDYDSRGLYPSYLQRLVAYLRAVEGSPAHLRMLQLASVTHVVAVHAAGFEDLTLLAEVPSVFLNPMRIYRVPDPLPRTYVVGTARLSDGMEALALLTDLGFDPTQEIVLPAGSIPSNPSSFGGTSRIVESRPDRVRLEADLEQDGYVVLVDTYDPGWSATVDGLSAEVLRANVAFRAIRVPAGKHAIEFLYRPLAFTAGLTVSLLTVFGILLTVVALRYAGRIGATRRD